MTRDRVHQEELSAIHFFVNENNISLVLMFFLGGAINTDRRSGRLIAQNRFPSAIHMPLAALEPLLQRCCPLQTCASLDRPIQIRPGIRLGIAKKRDSRITGNSTARSSKFISIQRPPSTHSS